MELDKLQKIDQKKLEKDLAEKKQEKSTKNIAGLFSWFWGFFPSDAVQATEEFLDTGKECAQDIAEEYIYDEFDDYAEEVAEEGTKKLLPNAAKTVVKFGSAAIGAAIGFYSTHKFCVKLLDKYEEFFKNNGNEIYDSYEKAKKYFNI